MMPRFSTPARLAAATLLAVLSAVPVAAQDATPSPDPASSPGAAPVANASPALVATASPAPAAATSVPVLGPPQATPNPVPMDVPTGDGTGVRLTTDLGDIVVGLFTESAPVATSNFLDLTEAGYYDGTGFHRVVPGFVIQGGDPEGTGAGGPGYTIPDEDVVGRYGRGIVAMARTPEPNSQGSQFFIVVDDAAEASLEAARTYVIFGRVVEGMDVVDAIVERGPASDMIEDPVRIQQATVEQVQLPPEPTLPPPTAAQEAAADLAAQLPRSVAGIELGDRAAFDSNAVRPQADPELIAELEALASEYGTDLERLSIARASGAAGEAFAAIVGVSIPGVPATDAQETLVRLIFGVSDGLTSTQETIGGRDLMRYEMTVEGGPAQVAYGLATEEVAWFFVADEGSLEEVAAALP